MQATLKLRSRSESGKGFARRLRRAGRIPGVIYGAGGETVMVSMDGHEATQLFHSVALSATVLELRIDGGPAERAVVREVQAHPFRPDLLHVDFQRVG